MPGVHLRLASQARERTFLVYLASARWANASSGLTPDRAAKRPLVVLALFSALLLIDVVLAGFSGVVARVRRMPVGRVCVVRRCYVISGLTLVRRFAMMPSRMLVMFGGAMMVLGGWVLVVHLILSKLAKPEP